MRNTDMVKGADPTKFAPGKAGTPGKALTKAQAATKTGSSAVGGPGRTQPAKTGQPSSGHKLDGCKVDVQSPTPARVAMDGPELPEPTEAEVESQIKQLLSSAEDSASSQEITVDLIIRSHISDDPTLSAARRAASEVFVQQLTHIRLDRQRLVTLNPDVLRPLSCATHLFLQHNCLTSTVALAALPGLKFLALGHNRIEKVEGLAKLTQLMFLDLSFNRIASLDERSLPPSLHFIKIEGNPCATGHANRYCLRRALKVRCPQLRHMDRDLDENGEDISDEDYDEEEEEEKDGADSGAEATAVGATVGEGEGGLLEDMLDMLDDLERRAYRGATARSEQLVRNSLSRSADLRTSVHRRASGEDVARSRPGSVIGTRPGTGRGGTGAISRPGTSLAAGNIPPSRPRSSGNSGTVAGTSTAQSSSARSPSPGPAGAGSGTASGRLSFGGGGDGGGGCSRPSSAGSVAVATAGRLAPGTPLPPPPRVQPGAAASGGTLQQQAAALERQVEDDLGMLEARLQALLEPTSSSTLTQDAAIFDARQLIHSQLDRIRGQVSERMSAQREADAAVNDAINRLRTSSTMTTLREQINLGPSKVAAARTAAAVAAARRAGPSDEANEMAAARKRPGSGQEPTPGGSGEQPRPWSSGSSTGGGGVPLQLPLGPGPVQTLPHNVLRESLSRLEGMLGGTGRPSSGRSRDAGFAVAALEPRTPGPNTTTSGSTESGSSKLAATTSTGEKATGRASSAADGSGSSGSKVATSGVPAATVTSASGKGLQRSSRPASGNRPGSASGRPAGAVMAAAKAAVVEAATSTAKRAVAAEVEAERLTGDDAGTEGLYSEEEDPEAPNAPDAPDFGFMFKSSLPSNPFGRGGAGPK